MPEITFVFGPNSSFFFDCPKVWKFDRIPGTLRQLFNSSMGPAWRIAQPYCVALAPQIHSPEPLWYVGCKVMTGEDKLFYSQTYFENAYSDLCQWTRTVPNVSRSCFVTFGLNMSYFACAPGYGSIWARIPSELEDKVRKSFDTPCCVSLGAHDAWFVLWPDGNCAWNFKGHYQTLDKILREGTPRSVAYVAISPYNKHHYFVTFKDQSLKYDFTGAPPEWMNLMTEVFKAWAAERLNKPPQHFLAPNDMSRFSTHLHQPLQPQQQAAYYYNNNNNNNNMLAELPPSPAQLVPMSPPLTPNTTLSGRPSPAFSHTTPNCPSAYQGTQQVEMPVELPDKTYLTASAPVPARSISTEKKKRFLSRLF